MSAQVSWVLDDARRTRLEQASVSVDRAWAMPSPATFTIQPISALLDRVLAGRTCIVDPFARGSLRAHHSNDLSPDFGAGLEAQIFLKRLAADGVEADAVLLDPPYSPRQMVEVYASVGLKQSKGMRASQTATLYSECKDLLTALALPGCIAVTCGWNSNGFGLERGWVLREVLMVAHGGAHNDTIVTVEEYAP